MTIKVSIPAWLAGLIGWLAGYLSAWQAARDRSDEPAAEAEKTAEQERAEAEAMDHDEISREVSRWTKP